MRIALVGALATVACTETSPRITTGLTATGISSGTGSLFGSTSSASGATGGSAIGSTGSTGGSSGSQSTGNRGTSTGPQVPCGPGRNWFGDKCIATDCKQVALGTSCQGSDGGGICLGTLCVFDQTLCGTSLVDCPVGVPCASGNCILSSQPVDCAKSICWRADEICFDGLGCLVDPCGPDDEGRSCPLDAGGFFGGQIGACCGSTCIDPQRDLSNCGNCGTACAPGERCISGVCAGPAQCGDPTNGQWCLFADGGVGTCCDGNCIDLSTSSMNCGLCGAECPPASCLDGACQIAGECPVGTSNLEGLCIRQSCGPESNGASCVDVGDFGTCCDQECTYLAVDPENCGACGVGCPAGWTCDEGTCAPVFDCAQAVHFPAQCILTDANLYDLGLCCGGQCVSYDDPQNCGGCGLSCPVSGICVLGHCFYDGGSNATCEDGGICSPGYDCVAGLCMQIACGPGFFGERCAAVDSDGGLAFGTCCEGICSDLNGDAANCGACGNQCLAGTPCEEGLCYDGPCGGENPVCPAGLGCGMSTDACQRLGCGLETQGEPCDFGSGEFEWLTPPQGYCCQDECVDLLQDPANCGECGRACASTSCSLGECVEPADAGACVLSCPALDLCVLGRCIDSLCQGATNTWCAAEDGRVGVCCGNGACADLLTDPQNCGLCGAACPAGQTCDVGACSGSPMCGPGSIGRGCGLDAGSETEFCCPGSGCTDIQTDPNNCGFCGFACQDGICKQGHC